MEPTRDFNDLVHQRMQHEPAFANALLREAVAALLAGDVETGKSLLRQVVKASVGFEALAAATGTPAKSLVRMLGPSGNPQARNLFGIIAQLQKRSGMELRVVTEAA